ncbi:MAG TPA: nucleotidyl transferase AbiEii/AbiGii toxin family protein [Chthoniobacter sp.]|nr:nucleotidyl transferase AbiEii/AbiGii toxin family protein [Chthoniobacter sp.]
MGLLNQLIRWLSGTKPPTVQSPTTERAPVRPAEKSALETVFKTMIGRQKGFAPTFGLPPRNDEPIQGLIFDPATQHFARAFRRGDPPLPTEEMQRWQEARREATWHLLDIVSGTEWADKLVLRGSLALKASLGAVAREPGDIDWVVQPAGLRMDQPEARRMMDGIVKAVTATPNSRTVKIDVSAIARNDIWTYERAPGHRIAFPWSWGALPPALVQMDFVFEQKLHVPPSTIRLSFADLPEVSVLAAGDEESLAWKLLWLHSDIHPQGKDLYDAVLLAERTTLRSSLLKTVLQDADNWNPKWISEWFPFDASDGPVDWDNFQKECPWVEGTGEEWVARLQKAIAPVVRELCAENSE